jgi:hypothetical protein
MDFVIELDNEGRIWVADSDGTTREEAWLPGADDTPLALRASGLCPLEEKYIVGRWTSTTLDQREVAGQLWVEASHET